MIVLFHTVTGLLLTVIVLFSQCVFPVTVNVLFPFPVIVLFPTCLFTVFLILPLLFVCLCYSILFPCNSDVAKVNDVNVK